MHFICIYQSQIEKVFVQFHVQSVCVSASEACKAGQYFDTAKGKCDNCPPGHVSETGSATSCTPCSNGTVPNRLRSKCVRCPHNACPRQTSEPMSTVEERLRKLLFKTTARPGTTRRGTTRPGTTNISTAKTTTR